MSFIYIFEVKHWIRDLVPFIRTHLEPITVEENKLSSIVSFVQSLSEILLVKTDSLLTTNSSNINDGLFSKVLEECIRYENEVSELITENLTKEQGIIPSFVNVLFSQPHLLNRWLSIERKGRK